MTQPRTQEGKWIIYECSTGRRLVRWPVDARPLLESGECTSVAPTDAAPEPDLAVVGNISRVELVAEGPTSHALGVPIVAQSAATAAPSVMLSEPERVTSKRRR